MGDRERGGQATALGTLMLVGKGRWRPRGGGCGRVHEMRGAQRLSAFIAPTKNLLCT